MSRLQPFLRRLALALSALTVTAVVAASGAPANANANAGPTARPTMAQVPGLAGVSSPPADPCRQISPWITLRPGHTFTYVLCVDAQGPVLVLLAPGPVGCVLTPGRGNPCTPELIRLILGF